MFTDQEFPAENKSLGDQNYVKGQKGYSGWERISKLIPDAVFVKDFNVEGAIQGCLNNCYLISSIASVAKSNPKVFDSIFVSTKLNPYGIYMARFYVEGILVQVVVDDYVPVGVDKKNKIRPYYASPSKQKQVWTMILEKCWAKLFKTYQRTDYGRPQEALYALTGYPFGNKSLQKVENQEKLADFLKLAKFQEKGSVFGTFIGKIKNSNQKQGLQEHHAYSVVYFSLIFQLKFITNPIHCVKLRNPTAQNSYKKDWKNELTKFYGLEKAILYLDMLKKEGQDLQGKAQNGIFFLDYLDFMSKFDSITVCHIKDNLNFLSLRSNFTKNKAKFFSFDLTKNSPIVISLSQMFRKMTQNFKNSDPSPYTVTKLILAKVVNSKNSSQKNLDSKVSSERLISYEFLGARSNVPQTAFNFLLFTQKDIQEEKEIIFEPGRYVIYASANIQKETKKNFTITVHNEDLCFPRQIQDLAELYNEESSPLVSMIGNLGIVDRNERHEKRWLEDVFLSKVFSDPQKLFNLKDFQLIKEKGSCEQLMKQAHQNQQKISLEESWFGYRIPYTAEAEKMGGFGYFCCHLGLNDGKSEYFGRCVEMMTTDEKFSIKQKFYAMTVKPGQTKIMILKLNLDMQNLRKIEEQYPLGENQNRFLPAPLPLRSTISLVSQKL